MVEAVTSGSCRTINKVPQNSENKPRGLYFSKAPFEGLIFGGAYSGELMYGGKFAFQNRLGQLVVGRKFTIFALFYFVFEGKFQVQGPRGAYIRRGNLTEGFCVTILGGLYLEGLIHEGAYFRKFTVVVNTRDTCMQVMQNCKAESKIRFIKGHLGVYHDIKASAHESMMSFVRN